MLADDDLTNFKYLNKGNMAVIGRGAAVVQLPKRICFLRAHSLAVVVAVAHHILGWLSQQAESDSRLGLELLHQPGASAILLKD